MTSQAETPVVQTRGLVKRYGDLAAVDGVDLSVPAGAVYGLLGPNGAGKTTFMRILFGLIRPDEGRIELFGRAELAGRVEALEDVAGFVETPRFYPYLSGRANLEVLATLDRRPGADERVETGRHSRHARAHRAAGRKRDHDPAVEPQHARGRGDLPVRRDHAARS